MSFERLEPLFHELRAMPPTARESRIEALRGEDPGLATELQRLLDAELEADTFLDEGASALTAQAGQPEVGDEIGGFRIVRVIASGGMGVVYHARQLRPERDVALKVVRPGLLGEELLRRFELEAEVLAGFDHPGIATVLAAGLATNRAGEPVPYLAMELVDGQPITAHVSERDSSVREIVALVARVADAVSHAHHRGVIHRDLKPGNVLVTAAGQPKVLDFGVARIERTGAHANTVAGQIVGTPAYMSPEQASGDPGGVDTRTDVHALGLILRELLAGEPAFDLEDLPLAEALARVRQARHDPVQHRGRPIERDLQRILDRALAPEKSERYGSAQDLAADLRRFLHHQPVEARPASLSYVLGKLLRRHPLVSAAAILAVLLLVGALLVVMRERDRADGNAARATAEARARARSLVEIQRLSDVVLLRDLEERAGDLGPARPGGRAALDAWLDEAKALARRLPEHESRLKALLSEQRVTWPSPELARDLQARLDAYDADLAAMDSGEITEGRSATELRARELGLLIGREKVERTGDEPARIEADSAELRWRYEVLRQLVVGLRRFTGPLGKLEQMQQRRHLADEIESLDAELAARWAEASTRLESDARFEGLRLRPLSGLVPLGRDPRTGLEEFLHWESHDGEALRRSSDGRLEIDEQTGIILVLVPGGTALTGASRDRESARFDRLAETNEGPVFSVVLDPFLIGKHEVTQGQWLRLTRDSPSSYRPPMKMKGARAAITWRHPVEEVSWDEAVSGLRAAALDLPTEVQWEYAARAGADTRFPEGDGAESLLGMVNISDRNAREAGTRWNVHPAFVDHRDGYATHAPVGLYRANAWGLHDVCGNVWEWCLDGWDGYDRAHRAGDGLRLSDTLDERIMRGGSFSEVPQGVRLANRHRSDRDTRGHVCGFRAAARLR